MKRSYLTLLVWLGLGGSALAHDPASVGGFVSTDPDDVILATSRGLMFGERGGEFRLLCSEGFGVGTDRPYTAALLPSGRLLIAGGRSTRFHGLRASDDRGCTFRAVASLGSALTPALVQHPTRTERVYVATFGKGASAVRVSDDGGETFDVLWKLADDDFVSSLRMVPTEPATLYAAGSAPSGDDVAYFVARSGDGGKTWERFAIELAADEREISLLAVNPAKPSELLAKTITQDASAPERLLVSRDGGKTFRPTTPATFTAIHSGAFSSDGATVLVSDRLALWRAASASGPFTKVGDAALMSAMQIQGDQLLTSGYFNGFDTRIDGVGVGALAASEFSTWMRFSDVSGLVTCEAPSTVEEDCAQLWTEWELERPPPPSADAGTARDAETTRDAADADETTTTRDGGGGCASADPGPNATGAGALSLLGLSLLVRRARRRRDERTRAARA